MRRLFSTFAPGWPGAGLLFMRLAGGVAAIACGITGLRNGQPLAHAGLNLTAIAAGIPFLLGFWTPLSGSLVALFGFSRVLLQLGDPWAGILLGTIGLGLALVGPGVWSLDSRLFGWKRINVGDPRN